MPPSYLVKPTFLGRSCGQGVNPALRDKLGAVEAELEGISGVPAGPQLAAWGGLRENIGGWRPSAGFHSAGSAVDLHSRRAPAASTVIGTMAPSAVPTAPPIPTTRAPSLEPSSTLPSPLALPAAPAGELRRRDAPEHADEVLASLP